MAKGEELALRGAEFLGGPRRKEFLRLSTAIPHFLRMACKEAVAAKLPALAFWLPGLRFGESGIRAAYAWSRTGL